MVRCEIDLPAHIRALLVCPSCRSELKDDVKGLICEKERLVYPVVDGVPHLVRQLAKSLKAPK